MKTYVVFYRQKGIRGLADEGMDVESNDPEVAVAKAQARAFGRKLVKVYPKHDDRPIYDATQGQLRQAFLPDFIDPFNS